MIKTLKITLAGLSMFAFVAVASASAPATNFARSLSLGSTGADVKELQMFLNACPDTMLAVAPGAAGSDKFETMTYGPATKVAVAKWQTKVNVTPASGYFGPLSRQTASTAGNPCGGNVPPNPAVTPTPAEALCPNGMTLASNCMTAPAAPVAPAETLCPNGKTLASNCMTAPSTTTPVMTSGAEGNLTNIAKLGLYNNTKVSEGSMDQKVYAIEMTAKDGDQKIDGLNVAFKNVGTGSAKFTRVASEVSVWLDGTKIGTKLASAYSDDAGDVYTYRFSGMNGVIKQNMKGTITVSVNAVNTFDTADVSGDSWNVEVGTSTALVPVTTNTNYISAVSSNGRYRDFGSDLSSSTIDFQKATGDATFKVVTSSTNPLAQNVQVSKTSDTNDKLLLAFEVKAENANMLLQKLPITMTSSGTLAQVAKNVKLYANGTLVTSETPTATTIFGNNTKLNFPLPMNTYVKFEVKADLNSTGTSFANYANGTTIQASYTTSGLSVELDNANKDTVTTLTGSATGELQTLRTTGTQVTMGTVSSSATSNNSGEILSRTITIPVTVKAFDETVFLDDVAENAATPSGTQAFAFRFEDSAGAVKVITNSVVLQSNATTEGNGYRVDAGTEKTFTLTIIVNGTTGHAQKLYRVQLEAVKSYSDAALTTGAVVQTLTPASAFETSSFALNLN